MRALMSGEGSSARKRRKKEEPTRAFLILFQVACVGCFSRSLYCSLCYSRSLADRQAIYCSFFMTSITIACGGMLLLRCGNGRAPILLSRVSRFKKSMQFNESKDTYKTEVGNAPAPRRRNRRRLGHYTIGHYTGSTLSSTSTNSAIAQPEYRILPCQPQPPPPNRSGLECSAPARWAEASTSWS